MRRMVTPVVTRAMTKHEDGAELNGVALSDLLERECRNAFETWIGGEPLPELLARMDYMQAAFNAFTAGMEYERRICADLCEENSDDLRKLPAHRRGDEYYMGAAGESLTMAIRLRQRSNK